MSYTHWIWDFDGTLFDTYPASTRALAQTLAAHGIQEPEAELMALIKRSMGHAKAVLQRKYALTDSFDQEYARCARELERVYAKPYPGIEQILREGAARGHYSYIFTHRGHSTIDMLSQHGLTHLFSRIITSEQGFAKKPDPEAIHALLEERSISKDSAIMMGDRAIDIQSAHNAGIAGCLFDPDDFTRDAQPDYTASSIGALRQILGLDAATPGDF